MSLGAVKFSFIFIQSAAASTHDQALLVLAVETANLSRVFQGYLLARKAHLGMLDHLVYRWDIHLDYYQVLADDLVHPGSLDLVDQWVLEFVLDILEMVHLVLDIPDH